MCREYCSCSQGWQSSYCGDIFTTVGHICWSWSFVQWLEQYRSWTRKTHSPLSFTEPSSCRQCHLLVVHPLHPQLTIVNHKRAQDINLHNFVRTNSVCDAELGDSPWFPWQRTGFTCRSSQPPGISHLYAFANRNTDVLPNTFSPRTWLLMELEQNSKYQYASNV